MATVFLDAPELYAGNLLALEDGRYVELLNFNTDTNGQAGGAFWRFEEVEGLQALVTAGFPRSTGGNPGRSGPRLALPAELDELFFAIRMRVESMPTGDTTTGVPVIEFRNASNGIICSLRVSPTGQIVALTGSPESGSEVARTPGPVLQAGTWHYIEVHVVRHTSTGLIEVRVDGAESNTLTANNLNLGSASIAGLLYGVRITSAIGVYLNGPKWRDVHVWDTTGDRNTSWLGDVRVHMLTPRLDSETGWTPQYRRKIGDSVGAFVTTSSNGNSAAAVSAADAAGLELGSGDFTLESFVRFNALPTGSNRATIIGKWRAGNNTRSWELSKCGPDLNSGNLEWRVSTDGTSETTVISWPWAAETDRWYHVAIVRDAGETFLYIDGAQMGVAQADANTYNNNAARLIIGCAVNNNTGTDAAHFPIAGRFTGWLDEIRLTPGVVRYSGNFTPTVVPFGRNSGDDPDFSSVTLLMGFEGAVVDESGGALALSAFNGAAFNEPNDGDAQYQTVDRFRDDTYISANFIPAEGVLTLDDNPDPAETVVIGTLPSGDLTYTFVSALTTAYDVLIGADEAETLLNLRSAINGEAGESTLYGTGTEPHPDVYAVGLPGPQMRVVARVSGTDGNAITTTATADGGFDDATLIGGEDLPDPSSFFLSRLPPDVTTIRSVQIVHRGRKTEAGTAKVQIEFVGPGGAADPGAEYSPPADFSYHGDVFEQDPDTDGPITPSTLIGGRVRFERTE